MTWASFCRSLLVACVPRGPELGSSMTSRREQDEFERIRLVAQIERARMFVAQYDEHQGFYRRQIEDDRYALGRLDERLGGTGRGRHDR